MLLALNTSNATHIPRSAYNTILLSCAREALHLTQNSSTTKHFILDTATQVWKKLPLISYHTTALMYKICGRCNQLSLAHQIRSETNDPQIFTSSNSTQPNNSTPEATAAYILALGNCRRAGEAEQLYFSHPFQHFRSNPRILSALFQSYIASDLISKAESLIAINGPVFLTVQACNAFVNKCTQLRLQSTALHFVHRMTQSTHSTFPPPNARTYNLLLRGLSSHIDTEDAQFTADRALAILDQMNHQKIQPTTVTCNALIRSFISQQQIDKAMALFHRMQTPNRITFSHLMQAAATTRDVPLAQQLLFELEKAHERPNYSFIKSYLEVVAHANGVKDAFREATSLAKRFGDLVVFGDVGSAEAIRMALMYACGTVGDVDAAFEAFRVPIGDDERGHLAPLYVCTVLMQVCLQCGEHVRALEVFDSLGEAGIKPNFEVYESLIYGLASYVSKMAYKDHELQDSIDEQRAQVGLNDEKNLSIEKHRQGRGQEQLLDVTQCVAMIVELIREMHANGMARTSRQAAFVYNTVVAAAAAADNLELALQIFNKMTKGQNRDVIYVARKEGEDNRRGIFESEFEFPAATVGTYNSMMYAAWKCGFPVMSFEMFEVMLADRTAEPNGATLSLLTDIGLKEAELGTKWLMVLLRMLDKKTDVSESLGSKRVRLRQKLVALRWSERK